MSILTDLLLRLRAIVFRRAEDRELDEELRLHVEMEEDYRRRTGVSHAEAHRQALIALGGIEVGLRQLGPVLALLAVGGAVEDEPVHRLETPPALDELAGEPLQHFGM